MCFLDEGIGNSTSSVSSNQNSPYNEARQMRVVSDGDLNTSGSSTDSAPRQRSAEQVRRPPLESWAVKNSRKGI